MKILPGLDYLETHLSKFIALLNKKGIPTEEEYQDAGFDILRTFGFSILRDNNCLKSLTYKKIKNVQFVTLLSLPISPSEETIFEKLSKQFEEKTGKKLDRNKHIVINVPNRLIGGAIYCVYEIPEE